MEKQKQIYKFCVNVFYNNAVPGEYPRWIPVASAQEIKLLAYTERQAQFLAHSKIGPVIMARRFPEKIKDPARVKLEDCTHYFKPDWR